MTNPDAMAAITRLPREATAGVSAEEILAFADDNGVKLTGVQRARLRRMFPTESPDSD
ncbi:MULTISPECIES: hypothetical protein [unclassified Corynebacterium]|uniref:hypothetical protein n=1 Tax=unclassified Corynebacterium TaxID=2624378 RepID=UPI000A3E2BAC|nr:MULTISPECIES: hypothetical protein [unclassified Corynebacterium]